MLYIGEGGGGAILIAFYADRRYAWYVGKSHLRVVAASTYSGPIVLAAVGGGMRWFVSRYGVYFINTRSSNII